MDTSLNNAEVIVEESDNPKKDSKYSWFVCFSGWLSQVLITGFLHGFGVFFVKFVDEFKASKSETGDEGNANGRLLFEVIMADSENNTQVGGSNENESDTNEQIGPSDKLEPWLICAYGFTSRVLIIGVLHGFGPFFIAFLEEFKITKEQSAWIASLAYGLSMTFGPVACMLTKRVGNRIVMVIGGIMCSVSLLTASFVTSIEMMFGTFSIFYGIGTCLCITPIMTIAPQYFDKYLTIAVGIITAGSSFGTLIYAPMSQVLIDSIGWRSTFRCYSGLCLISVIFSMFIKPLSTDKKDGVQRLKQSPIRHLIQDLKLWKNRVFVVWTIAITLVMFGFYIPYVHLVAYAEDCGIPPKKGAIFVMMLGASTAFGRLLFGKIVQYGYLNRLHMHQFSMVITGTGVILLPLLNTFVGISVYVVCVGLVDGCYVVLLPVLTATLVGVENTVLAWGFLTGTSSITFTAGPPIAGAINDMMGSYDMAFHIAGLPIIAGALVLFLIPWAQRTSKTTNVMIAVSEYNVDDDSNEALPYRGDSSTTLTGYIDGNKDFSTRVKGQTRYRSKRSKRYKDQGTSTSPSSIHVPTDIHEAISMFHENAKMIANLLQTPSGGLIAQPTSEDVRKSGKSRSDMMQNFSHGTICSPPHNVISIMSVPGGIAIGTFGGNATRVTSPESTSSNVSFNPMTSPRHSSHNSETSQGRSNMFDDMNRALSDIVNTSPGKNYQVYQFSSPGAVEGNQTSQTTPTTSDITGSMTIPFDQTICDQLSKLKDMSSPTQTIDLLQLESPETNTPVGSENESNFENNYLQNYARSPSYVSSPPKLGTIPEVPLSVTNNVSQITSTASKTSTLSETRHDNQQSSTKPSTRQSSSSISPDDQNDEVETNQADSEELDVFTHLFTDDQVEDSQH